MKSIIIIQPAFPSYREELFKNLNDIFKEKLLICYSCSELNISHKIPNTIITGEDVRFPGQLFWQRGVSTLPLKRNDILVVSGNLRYLSTIYLLVRARFIGVKTIVWGQYRSSTSKNWRMKIRLLLLRMGDALLFYTDAEIDMYRKNVSKKDLRPIAALNNGINNAPILLYRKPYVAVDRDRAIFFVGRLTHKANLGLLLSAMADPCLKSAVLHVVGTSETEKALRAQAEELGIANQVVWHGSTSDEAVIAAVANRCRLFVYPGEVGLSIIHAMAYGLPCVVHSDPLRHMPEIAAFCDGETGRTFTNNDVNALARTISEMMDATTDLQRFSENCIKTTETDYNTKSMARRFINFIEHLDLGEPRL